MGIRCGRVGGWEGLSSYEVREDGAGVVERDVINHVLHVGACGWRRRRWVGGWVGWWMNWVGRSMID